MANPRADPGDAAGVDLNAVLGRAVLDVVKRECRRHGNFWQGLACRSRPRSLVSNRATEENEDGADATVKKTRKRSPSSWRRSEQRRMKYMEDTHKANHHAAEEERICLELVQQGKVQFIA